MQGYQISSETTQAKSRCYDRCSIAWKSYFTLSGPVWGASIRQGVSLIAMLYPLALFATWFGVLHIIRKGIPIEPWNVIDVARELPQQDVVAILFS